MDGESLEAMPVTPHAEQLLQEQEIGPLQELAAQLRATDGRLVVAEDHYPQGGVGSAVLEALADLGVPVHLRHLAVRGLPTSGTSVQLMDQAGIGVPAIVEAARALVRV